MMTSTKWLGTAAVALVIGTGAVIAQTSPDVSQKGEDSPRAQAPAKQAPMKDAESPSTGEQRQKDRTAQQPDSKAAPKDMKDTQRSEDKSAPQRQQAQEPSQARDSKEPTRQTRDQSGQRSPADAAQQRQDGQKGREARQPADQKQQQSRDQQQKQDNQAADSKQPADAKQQTSQQPGSKQPASRDQASQPADARKGDTAQQPARDANEAASQQQQPGSATTTSSSINDQQRTEVRERLSRERTAMSRETQNLNIQVNVGAQLPPRVRPRPLPPDIVRIVPRYRGYEYTVIDDEIVVLEPRTRRVVEIIGEPARGSRMSASAGGQRIVIAPEHRETLKQTVRRSSTTGSTGQSGAAWDANCLTLQAVPEELTRANPDLGNYKMLAIGEQVVLIDPQEQKVVEVID
jgi:hypothetical protein